MNKDKGAAKDCASFAVMVKGYAGSYGAALKCLDTKECPENIREDIWLKLIKWSRKTVDGYKGLPETESIHKLLWDLGEQGFGFSVNVRDIPLEQEAIEICEIFGLNIYDLASADLELGMYSYPFPEGKTSIGFGGPGKKKILVNGEDESYLNRPGV